MSCRLHERDEHQRERTAIAEQRAKAGRPGWAFVLGVVFVLGTSAIFVWAAIRGILR